MYRFFRLVLHQSFAFLQHTSRSSHTVFWEPLNDSPCERLYFFCMILSQCSVVKLRVPTKKLLFSSFLVRNIFRTHFLQRLCHQRLCHQRLCHQRRVINDRVINDCVNVGYPAQSPWQLIYTCILMLRVQIRRITSDYHTMFLKHRCLSILATRFRPHIFRCYFLGAFQTV
jgi:hypothetical protein